MILKSHRAKLSRLLKSNFIPDVQRLLNEKGIVTNKGNEYSKSMISLVYNGKCSNEDIEFAILEVYNARKTKQAKMSVIYSNL